ncbi:MAG: hypothetical protein J5U19_11040 [Candidatus Methanoperedens sp.]|nr:hypothetical protein [Candidatus Methanoperedens sp.]
MISKDKLINAAIIGIIVVLIFMIVIINLPSTQNVKEEGLFPQIVGNMLLKSNETGIASIKNITSYDDFRGNIVDGYAAQYSGINGTMVIFIARMPDNYSALGSLKDMVINAGYNESTIPDENTTVIKIPGVTNPEIFLIQKSKNVAWHYTFTTSNKVYWISFDKPDLQYQMEMLREVFLKIN